MRLVSMPGDGRCMQHSVAYHLKSDVQLVMNRLFDFQTLFGNSRVHALQPETWADWIQMEFGLSLDDYKRGLFRRWGGTLDLVALTRILDRTIVVQMPNGKPLVLENEQKGCVAQHSNVAHPNNLITIRFNGSNHYDALE